jgi:hypothetical protein
VLVLGTRLTRFVPGVLLLSALAWLAQAIAALPRRVRVGRR